jgi:hypothetical protein
VCLGIGPQAWAWGGPVTHSGSQPVFTTEARLEALQAQIDALVTAQMLGPRTAYDLKGWVQAARRSTLPGTARGPLRLFTLTVQGLIWSGLLQPQAGALLQEAAAAAAACSV